MKFRFREKKSRKQIITEEILRFKKRVEKRFGFEEGRSFGPFVKPFVDWDSVIQDGVEWNEVRIKMNFTSDDSDMGVHLQV